MHEKKIHHEFTEVDLEFLHKADALLKGITLHDGHEWLTLDVNELAEVFHIAVKLHRYRRPKITLVYIASRCEKLSEYMEGCLKDEPAGSYMAHLMAKPREVAKLLRMFDSNELKA